MADFKPFSNAVHNRFNQLSEHELFTVNVTGDQVWEAYLASFPEGSNPIFRERTEHDCSCCRNFIKNLGNVVAIIDGGQYSVWSAIGDLEYPYNIVALQLAALIENSEIVSLYRTKELSYGLPSNVEAVPGQKSLTWNHFNGKIHTKHLCTTSSPERVIGEYNTSVAVFKRGLLELKPEAFTTVIELIDQNALYRGEEFLPALRKFSAMQSKYLSLSAGAAERYLWLNAGNPAVRFRNTAMGTLIQDLSEGVTLERAVASFEAKVAPTNYKRTSALITPRMIEDALKTVDDLGLREALERRFAAIKDISVNNVIWVSAEVQNVMKDGLAALLVADSSTKKLENEDAAPVISIADFMSKVVPEARAISALVKNRHQGNFVSLTAAVNPQQGEHQLFKWANEFAWSYDGNITDSIKERVKRAGGNTDAPLRISLAWFNGDDLDIHVKAPGHSYVISFRDKQGCLDVDMNAGSARNTVDPVENVSFRNPQDGVYQVAVNNYNRRSGDNPGFIIELENNGTVQQYSYSSAVKGGETVRVGDITVKEGKIIDVKFLPSMSSQSIAQEKWGVKTEQFTKVQTILFSPNHWDGQKAGNKHYIFALEGCLNPEPTRGIYNEFLNASLDKHRKVFEVLGAKTMCQPTDEQVSGVGFSSTKEETLFVQVEHERSKRNYLIQF